MGIGEYGCRCPMLAKHAENLFRISPFLAACVEFSIGVGSCPSLTETVVALRVNCLITADGGNVIFTVMNVFAPLDDNGANTPLYETKGCEEASRSFTYDNGTFCFGDIPILNFFVLIVLRYLVDVDANGEIDVDNSLPSVNALFKHPDSCHRSGIDGILTGDKTTNATFGGGNLR